MNRKIIGATVGTPIKPQSVIEKAGASYVTEDELELKGYLTEHQDISGKADVGHTHSIEDIEDYEAPDLSGYSKTDHTHTGYATTGELEGVANSIPTSLSELADDATHRLVTDEQMALWSAIKDSNGVDIQIPTHLSAFTDDVGFLTAKDIPFGETTGNVTLEKTEDTSYVEAADGHIRLYKVATSTIDIDTLRTAKVVYRISENGNIVEEAEMSVGDLDDELFVVVENGGVFVEGVVVSVTNAETFSNETDVTIEEPGTYLWEFNEDTRIEEVIKLEFVGSTIKTLPNKYLDLTRNTDYQTVLGIAKGANQAVAFDSYKTLIKHLNFLRKNKYRIGQNIYIETVGVPDLWVFGVSDEQVYRDNENDYDFIYELNEYGSVQVGFYLLAQLETQKVNLEEYVKKGTNPIATQMAVYGNDKYGNPQMFPASSAQSGDKVVMSDGWGCVKVADPKVFNDAVSLQYADNTYANKDDMLDGLGAISDVLSLTNITVYPSYIKTSDNSNLYYTPWGGYPSWMYPTTSGDAVIPEKHLLKCVIETKYYKDNTLLHKQTYRLNEVGYMTYSEPEKGVDLYAIEAELPVADIPNKEYFRAPTLLILYDYEYFNSTQGSNFPSNGVYLGTSTYDTVEPPASYRVIIDKITVDGIVEPVAYIESDKVEGLVELKSHVKVLEETTRALETDRDNLQNEVSAILRKGAREGEVTTINKPLSTILTQYIDGRTVKFASDTVLNIKDILSSGVIEVRYAIRNSTSAVETDYKTISIPLSALKIETYTYAGYLAAYKITIPERDNSKVGFGEIPFKGVSVWIVSNTLYTKLSASGVTSNNIQEGTYFGSAWASKLGIIHSTEVTSFSYISADGTEYAAIKHGLLLENNEFKELLARVEALEKKLNS